MAADQMRKLFIDQSVPREKLCTLFVESYDGLGRRSTDLLTVGLHHGKTEVWRRSVDH